MPIIDKILNGRKNGFFIECGAADGEGFSNSLFFELKKNWTGLLVEPNNEEFDILKQRHRKATLINACLSNTEYSNVKHTTLS